MPKSNEYICVSLVPPGSRIYCVEISCQPPNLVRAYSSARLGPPVPSSSNKFDDLIAFAGSHDSMLNLWSRAAQARSLCNCTACVTATGRILQRTSQAPLRRRLGRPDAFTVFSSTLVFSAAVAHGIKKNQNLEEWERIIQQTRADIEAVDREHDARIEKLRGRDLQDRAPWVGVLSEDSTWLEGSTWAEVLEVAQEDEAQRAIDGFQDWRGVPLSMLQNLQESDLKRILSEKWILHRYYGGSDCSDLDSPPSTHVYSTKKLRTLEWSVLKLVNRLLKHKYDDHKAEHISVDQITKSDPDLSSLVSVSAQAVQADLESIDHRLSQLRAEPEESTLYQHFPSPKTVQYHLSPSQCRDELLNFNAALESALFKDAVFCAEDVEEVCSALLRASVAPDINTYNLLLVRMCGLGSNSLVTAVLESMQESHMRPNEITHATLLRHFTLTKNKAAFRLHMERMNGFKGGFALAGPQSEIDHLTESRFRRLESRKAKFAELSRLNAEVYTCMIKGLIQMFEFKEAAWYYVKMIREGWKPAMELLTAMLKQCCDDADIASGWRVWRLMFETASFEQNVTKVAYELMLELCDLCGKPGLYHSIVQQGLQCGSLAPDFPDTMINGSISGTITTAIDHTFTTAELQNRFPYLPVGIVKAQRQTFAREVDPVYKMSSGSEVSTSNVYSIMQKALLQPSLVDARGFIRAQTSIPRRVSQSMEKEVNLVFANLQALSDLNEEHARKAETDHEGQALATLDAVHNAWVERERKKGGWSLGGQESNTHQNLIAAIQAVDASLTPRTTMRAYHRFRTTSIDHEDRRKADAPINLNTG